MQSWCGIDRRALTAEPSSADFAHVRERWGIIETDEIDETVIEIFSNGQCHALAAVCAARLGAPLIAVKRRLHVAVDLGSYVGDVSGLHQREWWCTEWSYARSGKLDRDTYRDVHRITCPVEAVVFARDQKAAMPDIAAARVFCDPVIDRWIEAERQRLERPTYLQAQRSRLLRPTYLPAAA